MRFWNQLQQFEYGMWSLLQCIEVYTLVLLIALGGHVSVILEDFANLEKRLRWK